MIILLRSSIEALSQWSQALVVGVTLRYAFTLKPHRGSARAQMPSALAVLGSRRKKELRTREMRVSTSIRDYLKQGEESENAGRFRKAIEYYSMVLHETTDRELDCVLRYKRGCLYEKIGENESAAEDFKNFLSADKRIGKGGSSAAGWLHMFAQTISIENQRINARKFLSTYTFHKILTPSVPFDYYYQDKKLYDWGHVPLLKTSEETSILENNPQEEAYRRGVKCFLQGKHEEATALFDEAISINPEDARFYLFRAMIHALESQRIVYALPKPRGKLFGSSKSARELSWSKFESDLQKAQALSEKNEAVERACLRVKYWLVDYERELTALYAGKPTLAARFLGFIGTVAVTLLGITFLTVGIASIFLVFSPFLTAAYIGSGILSLIGAISFKRGKKLRGTLLIILAFLVLITVLGVEGAHP